MTKAYEYIALEDGILSDPYRRVKAGQKVSSPEPIEAKWLAPVVEGQPLPGPKRLPVAPYLSEKKPKPKEIKVMDVPSSDNYQKGVKKMQEIENAIDSKSLTNEQKMDKVVEAIGDMDPNSEKDYTTRGKPDAKILRDVLGFDVSAQMRDEAFKRFQEQDDTEPAEQTGDEESTGSKEVL